MTKCTPCRVRHLTCDKESTCSECTRARRECIRGYNLRFRHLTCPSETPTRADYSKYEFFFEGNQTWLEPSEKVEFVLEDDVSLTSPLRGGLKMSDVKSVMTAAESQEMLSNTSNTPIEPTALPGNPLTFFEKNDKFVQRPLSRLDILANQSLADECLSGQTLRLESKISYPQTPVPSALAWPLGNVQEGRLLQHWVSYLAPWFDAGDSKRHFARLATVMATSSPLLRNAILALAALHHGRVIGETDTCDAMDYHDRCLNMMVPMLSDPDRVNDDCVLVTTVILHLYEDLELGNDSPRHLKGTSLFFPAEATTESSQLRRAVFWVYLEQEIYNAYAHQRSVRTDFSLRDIESYIEDDADDDVWFRKMLYIAAFVSKWAFGDENSSRARWRELCLMVDGWEENRPASFHPVYFRDRNPQQGRFFPEVCYVTDEGVNGSHFFYLAKLLLTTHDPNLPRIGPRMQSAMAAMQGIALSYVRRMVGIALCNNYIPARFTASLGIIVCSSWFTDRREQKAILEFMSSTDRCSGWPRTKARRDLIKGWGWEEEASA